MVLVISSCFSAPVLLMPDRARRKNRASLTKFGALTTAEQRNGSLFIFRILGLKDIDINNDILQ